MKKTLLAAAAALMIGACGTTGEVIPLMGPDFTNSAQPVPMDIGWDGARPVLTFTVETGETFSGDVEEIGYEFDDEDYIPVGARYAKAQRDAGEVHIYTPTNGAALSNTYYGTIEGNRGTTMDVEISLGRYGGAGVGEDSKGNYYEFIAR